MTFYLNIVIILSMHYWLSFYQVCLIDPLSPAPLSLSARYNWVILFFTWKWSGVKVCQGFAVIISCFYSSGAAWGPGKLHISPPNYCICFMAVHYA